MCEAIQICFSICAIDLSFGYCTVVELFCLEHVLIFNVFIDIVCTFNSSQPPPSPWMNMNQRPPLDVNVGKSRSSPGSCLIKWIYSNDGLHCTLQLMWKDGMRQIEELLISL